MNQLWFVSHGQQIQGPFSPAQLREEVKAGRLQPQHLLRLQENKNWVKAASIKGLFPTTTALTASPAVSKNSPVAVVAAPAAKASSAKTGLVIAALAIGSVLLLLVLAGGVFAAVWFFRSSGPDLSSVADASASITMPSRLARKPDCKTIPTRLASQKKAPGLMLPSHRRRRRVRAALSGRKMLRVRPALSGRKQARVPLIAPSPKRLRRPRPGRT